MSSEAGENSIIFCPLCGHKNPGDALFCIACGRNIPRFDELTEVVQPNDGPLSEVTGIDVEQNDFVQAHKVLEQPQPHSPHSTLPDALLPGDFFNQADDVAHGSSAPLRPRESTSAVPQYPTSESTAEGIGLNQEIQAMEDNLEEVDSENGPITNDDIDTPNLNFSYAPGDASSKVQLHRAMEKDPNGRPICGRCGRETSLFGTLSFDKSIGLCGDCKNQVRRELYNAFYQWCPLGVISEQSLHWLGYFASERGMDGVKAISLIRTDATARLRSVLAAALDDIKIVLTNHDFSNMPLTFDTLGITFLEKRSLEQQVRVLTPLMPPRMGTLPVYTITHIYLESDEVCHLSVETTTYRKTRDKTLRMTGEFIATSKRLIHRGPEGTIEIPWKNIMRITRNQRMVHLELTNKRGAGFYEVDDPIYVANLLRILALSWKRQIVFQRASSSSRHIPQDVKTAVWHRDGGVCVQCGAADYLEFDHIIPHSKGGANTVNNVQLLCRKCNAEKSDRI